MPVSQVPTPNLLLQTLLEEDYAILAPDMNRVKLDREQVLAPPNQLIEHIYFLEGGIGSIVSINSDEDRTEVGIFGYEGMSGLPVLLGSDTSPHEVFVQVDGASALRIDVAPFTEAIAASTTMRGVFLRYVQTLLIQSSQSTVANAHNTIEARLARWLLMCHDRVDGDDIRLTHQFMSMMVAAQRTGVTLTLHILEGAGIIRSQRALVTIVDRERLQELAGGTYGLAEREYARLIAPFGKGQASLEGVTLAGS